MIESIIVEASMFEHCLLEFLVGFAISTSKPYLAKNAAKLLVESCLVETNVPRGCLLKLVSWACLCRLPKASNKKLLNGILVEGILVQSSALEGCSVELLCSAWLIKFPKISCKSDAKSTPNSNLKPDPNSP